VKLDGNCSTACAIEVDTAIPLYGPAKAQRKSSPATQQIADDRLTERDCAKPQSQRNPDSTR
jgi:hypothetical protein